ncbi:MAG: hypothetical protein ABIZ34_05235 [Candidatus Limnocylindrales bacterium]
MVVALLVGVIPVALTIASDAPMAGLLAAPAILYVPGYLLLAAAGRGARSFGATQRSALSVVISLTVTIGIAPVLQAMSATIDRRSLGLGLLVVQVLAFVSWLAMAARSAPWTPTYPTVWQGRRMMTGLGLVAVTVVLVSSAVVIAVQGARSQVYDGTVQAWLSASSDGSTAAVVSVRNLEPGSVTCEATRQDSAGTTTWPAFTLLPGETWTATLALAGPAAISAVIDCRLADGTTLERRLRGTIP